jgi:hypothetical protein
MWTHLHFLNTATVKRWRPLALAAVFRAMRIKIGLGFLR